MRQLDHEAFATLVLALLITALFWLGLTLYAGSPHDLLGLPLWFVFSCLGGYLLSVVGVAVLVKKYFADMSLDEPEEPDKPGDKAPPAV